MAKTKKKKDKTNDDNQVSLRRYTVQSELVDSDRDNMMGHANELVESMVNRQLWNAVSGSVNELSDAEEGAYNAALGYLERQFHAGHSDSFCFTTKEDQEFYE